MAYGAETETLFMLGLILVQYMWVVIIIGIWDAVWKAIGMYRAAVNKQKAWFVVMFIFNTAGILPIIYLYCCQKSKKSVQKKKKKTKR